MGIPQEPILLMDVLGQVHKFSRIDAVEAIASKNYFELRENEIAKVTSEGYIPLEHGEEILNIIRSRTESDNKEIPEETVEED
jgi:hypothetical protein